MVAARGSVFVYILVGTALFAALMFTLSRSSSNSTSLIGKGQAKLYSNRIADYTRSVDMAVEKLQLRGCSISQISYETPDGANINANAPSDKSCNVFHIKGGGVIYDPVLSDSLCNLSALALGQSCMGIVYAGTSSGTRLYTTISNLPVSHPYNNGSYNPAALDTGATSETDGFFNTQILTVATGIYAPYRAARACAALGAKWYLPARKEMRDLFLNRGVGDLVVEAVPEDYYWTSTELSGTNAWTLRYSTGGSIVNRGNNISLPVRCVRRD